jgi:hypothetical protein
MTDTIRDVQESEEKAWTLNVLADVMRRLRLLLDDVDAHRIEPSEALASLGVLTELAPPGHLLTGAENQAFATLADACLNAVSSARAEFAGGAKAGEKRSKTAFRRTSKKTF